MRYVSNALLMTHQAGDDSVLNTISDIRTGRPSLQFYRPAVWKKGLCTLFIVEFNFWRGRGKAIPVQTLKVPGGGGSYI
jgi:hypothetical protein